MRRVRGDGTPLAQPTAVAAAEQPTHPALLELPDERVVVAWEEPGGGTRIRLRLLHPELQAATETIDVPAPASAAHRGPRLARAPGGGFLVAWTAEQEIMGVRHRKVFVEGVQFHPESILTLAGKQLLGNFLSRLPARAA